MRAILTYHSIDPSGSAISIDEAAFARHVAFLASSRIRVVALRDLLTTNENDAVAITFDDGLSSFATIAWPRLRDAGLPVTLFVVSGFVGRANGWDVAPEPEAPELQLMDWESVARVAGEGVDLGSHSRTHPYLTKLDDAALEDEVAGAKEDIERYTGTPPWTFCYPFGAHDARTVATVRNHHGAACTTMMRGIVGDDDPHALPRLDAYYLRRTGLLESFGSPGFRAYVRVRAGLRRLRRGG